MSCRESFVCDDLEGLGKVHELLLRAESDSGGPIRRTIVDTMGKALLAVTLEEYTDLPSRLEKLFGPALNRRVELS